MSLDEFVALQNARATEAEGAETPRLAVHPLDQNLIRYRTGPGDVLAVTLTGLDGPTISVPYSVRVDPNGNIDLPLVGDVHVAGMDESQAEVAIKTAYVPNVVRQLTVNLAVVSREQTRVLVTGAVGLPGFVSLPRSERTVLFAVAAAGGISETASGVVTLHRVRSPGRQETVNLLDAADQAKALAAAPLQSGDIVMVGAAQPNTIFVGGLVNRPSPQAYPAGVKMSVLQVLASAGGLREDVYPTQGTLIRRMADGSDVRVKLNFPRIQSGKDENITLAAGDILWVPQTVGTKVLDFFNRNLFIRGGATITYNASGTEFLNSNSQAVSLRNQNLEDQFNPFGFLDRGAAINQLGAAAPQPRR